jgi:hypothetical protein
LRQLPNSNLLHLRAHDIMNNGRDLEAPENGIPRTAM